MIRVVMLAVAIAAAAPAFAEDQSPSVKVDTAGLDLSTPAGQDQLRTRIAAAVSRVCVDDSNSVLAPTAAAVCRRDTAKMALASFTRR